MIAASKRAQGKALARATYQPAHDAPIPAWLVTYTNGK